MDFGRAARTEAGFDPVIEDQTNLVDAAGTVGADYQTAVGRILSRGLRRRIYITRRRLVILPRLLVRLDEGEPSLPAWSKPSRLFDEDLI